jgi:hypothetical protein
VLGIVAEGVGAENGSLRKRKEPKFGPVAARSSVYRRDLASSPSPQVKAALIQVGH